uniref:Uncharacterized protein n=1 Tax=Arundo donax TaxID=35708 RepID=A0A0A8YRY2_ARUDO
MGLQSLLVLMNEDLGCGREDTG